MSKEIKKQYSNPVLKLYTIDKRWICNLTNATLKNSAFGIKKKLKTNEISTLSFRMNFNNEYVTDGSCEYLVEHENEFYIIKNVKINSSDKRYIDVSCESEFTTSKTVFCTHIESIGVTPLEMFDSIMEVAEFDLGYQFLGTDIDYNRSLVVEDEKSVFENLLEMAKVFNCIMEFRTDNEGDKGIYFRSNPVDRGKVVRRGRDLKQLDINVDSSGLFTRLQPFGAINDIGQETNIMDVNPSGMSYIENYTYFLERGLTIEQIKKNPQAMAMSIRRFSDITDENHLMIVAQEELERISKPRVSGTLSYSDLGVYEDSGIDYPVLFEKIIVADKDINMKFSSNIMEIEIDYDNILESKLTLDNIMTYNSIIKDLVSSAETLEKITGTDTVTGKPTLVGGVIQGHINSEVAQIGQVLDSIDKQQAVYGILYENRIFGHELFGALAIGVTGILISSELNEDNTWNWTTAISSRSVNASAINTGLLRAELIKAGILSDINNSSWINMETGEFNFKDKIKFIGNQFTIDLSSKNLATNDDIANLGSELEKEISDVVASISSLETNINGAFRDGVLTQAEKESIRVNLTVLATEYKNVSEEYKTLYNNSDLVDSALKSSFALSYSNYQTSINKLIEEINEVIVKDTITELDKTTIANLFTEHDNKLALFVAKKNEVVNAIAENKKNSSIQYMNGEVDKLNNKINGDIQDVNKVIDTLENDINTTFRDGVLTEAEKESIRINLNTLKTEQLEVGKEYLTLLNNSDLVIQSIKTRFTQSFTNYNTATNNLISVINVIILKDDLLDQDRIDVSNGFIEHDKKLEIFIESKNEVIDVIMNKKKEDVSTYVDLEIGKLETRIDTDIESVSNSVETLETNINTTFKDGILTQAEKESININLNILNTEISEMREEFNTLHENPHLTNNLIKTAFSNSFNEYNIATNNLISTINTILNKEIITSEDKLSVSNGFVAHDSKLEVFIQNKNSVIDSITDKKKNDVSIYVDSEVSKLETKIDADIKGVSDSINNLETDVNGSIKDGILTEAEKESIKINLNLLNTELVNIEEEYNTLYNNSDLINNLIKTSFATSFTEYKTATNSLINTIKTIILKSEILEVDRVSISNGFTTHDSKLEVFVQNKNSVIDEISNKKKSDAIAYIDEETSKLYNEIQSGINDVSEALGTLETNVNGSIKDGILTEAEKESIRLSLKTLEIENQDVDSEFTELYANVDLIGVAKTNLDNYKNYYNTRYNTLTTHINKLLEQIEISTTDKTNLNTYFDNYKTYLGYYRVRVQRAIESISEKKKDDSIGYTDTQFQVLDGKIASKVDVNGVKSTVEQNPDSIKIGFNKISNRVEITEDGLNINDNDGNKAFYARADGNLDIRGRFTSISDAGYKSVELDNNLQIFRDGLNGISDFVGGIRKSNMDSGARGFAMVADNSENYLGFGFTNGDEGIDDPATLFMRANRNGNIHFFKNVDMNWNSIQHGHLNEDNIGDNIKINKIYLSTNQINSNYSSGNLVLNHARMVGQGASSSEVHVNDGSNTGGKGVIRVGTLYQDRATMSIQSTDIGYKQSFTQSSMNSYIEDTYFSVVQNGICIINFDVDFLAQANTNMKYHVQVTGYEGSNFKIERESTYVKLIGGIEGEEVSVFIKANLIGQENLRYEVINIDTSIHENTDNFMLESEIQKQESTDEKMINSFYLDSETENYKSEKLNFAFASEIIKLELEEK